MIALEKEKSLQLHFTPLEKFGVEIDSLDLKKLDHQQILFVKETLANEGMIIFRNQALDDKDLVHFAQQVGDGRLESSASRINHGRLIKEVGYITSLKDPEGEPLGFAGNTTDFWHSDQEFRESPASLGILFCLIPPIEGGETSFVSTTTSFFEEDEITVLKELLTTRKPADFHDNAPRVTVAHPAILQNPLTGHEYVYVSENTIDFIDKQHSKQPIVKEDILKFILKEDNIYGHSWKCGDTILYDNAQLLHRREKYEGIRFIKALKIYPDKKYNTVIDGYIIA